jgi:hypothetical protein
MFDQGEENPQTSSCEGYIDTKVTTPYDAQAHAFVRPPPFHRNNIPSLHRQDNAVHDTTEQPQQSNSDEKFGLDAFFGSKKRKFHT